jgi:uncharacterized LabA/DUF88 family protein
MAALPDTLSMALFCDFENVALGVRDANYEKFDIKPVLERLLLKGSIVVKKAYCDWERYKAFKAGMHEANFELIEIPHVRQSGKNSADIRLVVDALDLCYTKLHVDTFVIISGDSDFSPLVSKLRENAKYVIGVGVKQSTSDLLIANCDEFIFYDDLVRDQQRQKAHRDGKEATAPRRPPEEEKQRREEHENRRNKAVELAVATFEDLMAERGDNGKIWASVLKEAIKRRNPGFNESYFGFRAFGNLLEEARSRGLLEVGRDEKSGAYVFRANSRGDNVTIPGEATQAATPVIVALSDDIAVAPSLASESAGSEARGSKRSRRSGRARKESAATDQTGTSSTSSAMATNVSPAPATTAEPTPLILPELTVATQEETASATGKKPRRTAPRRSSKAAASATAGAVEPAPAPVPTAAPAASAPPTATTKPARSKRPRKPAKTDAT